MVSRRPRHSQQENAEQERMVIERFCARHREDARVLGPNQPPAPDFTIAIAGKEVLVELTRYREQGPHNDAADRDLDFKHQFCERWLYDSEVNHLSVFLYYRENNGHFTVPRLRARPDKFEELISELKALADQVNPRSCEAVVRVRFVPQEMIARYDRHRRPRQYFVSNKDFLVLDHYFQEVMFRHHPTVKTGLPVTSLNSRGVGLDFNEIKRVFLGKSGKIGQYREKAGNRGVWLLFYSEGWPPTAHLWKDDVSPIIDYVGLLINEANQRFDSVWWGNNILTEPGQSFHKII